MFAKDFSNKIFSPPRHEDKLAHFARNWNDGTME
jgi:hypothetical protein